MIAQLQDLCRSLLETDEVQVVIAYGQSPGATAPHPIFITEPADCARICWNRGCHHNLTVYLTRAEIKALGRPAILVKACDERALVVLQRESQVDRSRIHVVGVACDAEHCPATAKCDRCRSRVPRFADSVVGAAASVAEPREEAYAELHRFLELPIEERMAFWQDELQRCTKCYACRQACPLCYCQRCIVDKNRPVVIDGSATLKGNFAWHITRAFHLAGRCVGCDACTRACPVGIDLRLLNMSLACGAEEDFGYRPGEDHDSPAVVGAYREQDEEAFIR
jgi:ferredoxin